MNTHVYQNGCGEKTNFVEERAVLGLVGALEIVHFFVEVALDLDVFELQFLERLQTPLHGFGKTATNNVNTLLDITGKLERIYSRTNIN